MPQAPRLGIQPAPHVGRPVGLLLPHGEEAPPGPIPVGELTILIERGRQPVGRRPQVLGRQPTGQLGQLRLGGFTGVVIDEAGQLGEELPDDRHMLGADQPALLRGGGVRQHRL